MKESFIYITSNKNRTVLYIGITSNLKRRIEEHKNGNGSYFSKKYNCNELIYFEKFTDISLAIKREKQLKNWHSDWKWNLIKEFNPQLIDLYFKI
ncbi:GIY-YIG nuclease family protein [uncultured Lutibacter sp.]|uniref:GIY-YIG nuclease family protein n=1 Tax=uncultured Lutibacter sp. TaxID=437739 RepID=UPI002611F353|nr:GIY-YIG nuclease family protein [uncultured Lutibacter sp.]